MNLQELRNTLERLDLKPSRKLGQNFLIDGNTLRRLLSEADVSKGDFVVEIGPGTGALTELLLAQEVSLTAIEYDVRLADYLQERFGGDPGFTLIQADAGRFDFDELTAGRSWCCSANLPYSVSTVILGGMLSLQNPPRSMTLLLQREMAERICAAHGSKVYGAMSVRVQMLYEAKMVKVVPPTVFWPRPDVDSGILRLTLRGDRAVGPICAATDRLIRYSFEQRRKKLLKRLTALHEGLEWAGLFEELGLSVDVRAEQLTVEQFRQLGESYAKAL